MENAFLRIEKVGKTYTNSGRSIPILENINLTLDQGEFVTIIGHSGCGKSTLLNMVAGFSSPSQGKIFLGDRLIQKPGPDRMMVFQNYALLPWLSAFDNIYLPLNSVYPQKSKAEKTQIVEEHLELVGLSHAAHKKPKALSGGMKQRVSMARALALYPQLLILDEPFGALDVITRKELEDELLKIWTKHQVTVMMVTHDIDEALFLADRIIMMTPGKPGSIGKIVNIPFIRPRNRSLILEDHRYYELRNETLNFLFQDNV
jgi:nitrate ABC transporter ATP-binding subunit